MNNIRNGCSHLYLMLNCHETSQKAVNPFPPGFCVKWGGWTRHPPRAFPGLKSECGRENEQHAVHFHFPFPPPLPTVGQCCLGRGILADLSLLPSSWVFANPSYSHCQPNCKTARSTPRKTDQRKADHQSPGLSGVSSLGVSQS